MEIKEPAIQYGLFPKMTAAEYLDWERDQEERHEYIQGEIVAMSGASFNHNRLQANLIVGIGSFLKGKECNIFGNDLRIEAKSSEAYWYPDVTIICGEIEAVDHQLEIAKNPTVVIEILSPSTQRKDMGKKKFFYMQIPSLKEYIMIDSQSVSVETIRRRNDGTWENLLTLDMNDTLFINTINFQMPLVDIYANIKF
jgi:Uma2 family endonuclease